jgi:HlyD family secretion protein
VTLDNRDGFLKPGMNGEVSVLIDERINVLAVPNDAVRNTREAVATAPLLGLDPDSVQAQLRAQFGGMRGRGGGVRQQGQGPTADRQDRRGGSGGQQVDVSDRQCADVQAAIARRPADGRKLDDLQARMRAAGADRRSIAAEMRAVYQSAGVDPRVAIECRRRERPASGDTPGGDGGAARATMRLAPSSNGVVPDQAPPVRTRPGLVFVAEGSTYKPRVVMLGAGNYDYTEVVSGLREGERVALLASLTLQAQREEQAERIRSRMGGIPGMQGGGGGGGGARGGAAGGGGPR